MNIKKIHIAFMLILLLIIATFFSVRLTNIFITPIVLLISNIENENYKPNKYLIKHGINIKLKKYEWSHNVKNMSDRIIINFTGNLLTKKPLKYQAADMHILDNNISYKEFLKISKLNIGNCDKTIKKVEKINNNLLNYTLCINEDKKYVHYDIPQKKIMITFYPYSESKKQLLQSFIDGIEITRSTSPETVK